MIRLYLRNFREAITLLAIALLVGLAAYSLLGIAAWTFKSAVEVSAKIKRTI